MPKLVLAATLAAFAIAVTGFTNLTPVSAGDDTAGYHETQGKKKKKKQSQGSGSGS